MTKSHCTLSVVCSLFIGVAGYAQEPVQVKHLSIPTEMISPQAPQSQQTPASSSTARGSQGRFDDVQGQIMRSYFTHTAGYEYGDIKLPPLEVIMESARNNPRVEYFKYRNEEEQAELKSVKREWMKHFHIVSSYQYGSTAISADVENYGPIPSIYNNYANQVQSWWYVGAYMSFPLDGIFDRGNRIKKQKAIINQTEYEIETWYNEQQLKIIEAYTNAGMYLALIQIKSEAATIATQQFAMCQAEYINGRMDIAEITRQKGMQNVAVTEFEQTRAKLYEAILRLETLANYKILNK